jgi:hypothetical protein
LVGPGGEIEAIVAFVDAIQTFAGEGGDPIDKLQNDPDHRFGRRQPIMLRLNEISSMRILLYNMFDMLLGTGQFNVGNLVLSEHNQLCALKHGRSGAGNRNRLCLRHLHSLENIGLTAGGFHHRPVDPGQRQRNRQHAQRHARFGHLQYL